MKLVPVLQTEEENLRFLKNPNCADTVYKMMEFYRKHGFEEPWMGYCAEIDGELVGSCGFKGRPANRGGNKIVEIAYVTFEQFRQQGYATQMCQSLIELSLKTDASLKITARTLPEKSYSVRILKKMEFLCTGTIIDHDGIEVWEWEYRPSNSQ